MRTVHVAALAAAVAAVPAQAQPVRGGANVGAISCSESGEQLQYDGGAAGALLDVRFGRFMVMAEGYVSRLDPDAASGLTEQIDLRQFDLRAAYFVNPALAIQIGASGRQATPEFATTDVGFFRVGLISENRLGNIARIWVRGSYIPSPSFSGGGSSKFAFEIGLGAWIGTSNGRIGARFEYDFQRIDREVKGVAVPQQLMVAKLGIEVGI
jgi:opacity protein-like surface antigen